MKITREIAKARSPYFKYGKSPHIYSAKYQQWHAQAVKGQIPLFHIPELLDEEFDR